jgi:8-oxo-dGTP pyrophosphatase MutT (NUDIX family)
MWRAPGDGWITCEQGHRHWGTHGAAGLLVTRVTSSGTRELMLQHRAAWTHQGDTWGLPGGARRPEESAEQAALREAGEEIGLPAAAVRTSAVSTDHHGGWSYTTVVAQVRPRFAGESSGDDIVGLVDLAAAHSAHETADVAWVAVAEVDAMPLHPGFRATWPQVAITLEPPTLLVDAANVVGSRPDGWWRDRVGAHRTLLGRLRALAATGVARTEAPWRAPEMLEVWYPRIVVVLEGQAARGLTAEETVGLGPSVEVVRAVRSGASGTGDDLLFDQAVAIGRSAVAVTADRELRRRLESVAVGSVGPRWLWDLIDDHSTSRR